MKMENLRDDKKLKLEFAGLIILVILVASICVFYVKNLERNMKVESDRYLGEVASQVGNVLNDRLDAVFYTMDIMALTCASMDSLDQQLSYLKLVQDKTPDEMLGVVDRNGLMRLSSGGSVDLSEVQAVQRALTGAQSLSGCVSSPVDGSDIFLYCVPMSGDNGVVGAVVASMSAAQFRELLNVGSFNQEGYTQIVDANGSFLIDSQNKNAVKNPTNLFQTLERQCRLDRGYTVTGIQNKIEGGMPGVLYYRSEDGIHKVMNYQPLAREGWYLLSVVPTKETEDQWNSFILLAIAINISIVLLFAGLICLIIQMQKKNRRRLENIAFVDPVTGGMNRTRFEMEAQGLIEKAEADTYALISLDIQKFKLINDAFGSSMGNKTLKYVHDVIQRHLKPGEIVSRISADTYDVLMKNRPQEEFLSWLKELVEEINVFNEDLTDKYFLPIYAGVYVIREKGLHMITMQDRANVARKNNKQINETKLYSCVFYSDMERVRMIREKEITNRMQTALENREFVVYLQPKMDIETNTVSGAEALVRWQDPEKGLLQPGEFIPVFEKNGFIVKLDLFVFEEVCRLLRRWIDQGIDPIPISVNLSRVHLKNPDFLNQFRKISEQYQIPPQLLEIELTETVVFENLEFLIHVIEQIHDMGFRCSLDDFGSGYSSLNMLKDVPVDVLKLDRAFFQEKKSNAQRGKCVIENVIELARKLDMDTVSEGVETMHQVEFLREAKCHMVQGYVFSRPITISDFEAFAFSGNSGGEPE